MHLFWRNNLSETLLELSAFRALEEKCSRVLGSSTLLERAGKVAAQYISKLVEAPASITVLCGPGNNGGDGFVCALRLKEMNYNVVCVQVAGKEPKSDEAKAAKNAWLEAGGLVMEDPYATPKATLVVDAIFGIGLNRPLKDDFLDAAMWFNERQAIHVSLDIPSGLNSENGTWVGKRAGCRADHTITFLAGKLGLFTADGLDACGHIHTDNLGVSIPLSNFNLTEPIDFRHVIEPRILNTSKRNFGRVGVIGGGKGTVGAALIAARAALRTGAGAVYVELVESDVSVDPVRPELMFRDEIELDKMDAVVVGPGLGFSARAKERLQAAIANEKPLIVDADAITMIAQDENMLNLLSKRKAHTVITPHVAEAARILRLKPEEIEADRIMRTLDLALVTGALTVLKGAGSVIALRSSRCWINPTGTPALATAGSGDALSGIIASMYAQHFDQVAAPLAAVYLHGAASENHDIGLLADEIAEKVADVINTWRKEARLGGVNTAFNQSQHARVATHDIYSL